MNRVPNTCILNNCVFTIKGFLAFLVTSKYPSPFNSTIRFFRLNSLGILILLCGLNHTEVPSGRVMFTRCPLGTLISVYCFFCSFCVYQLAINQVVEISKTIIAAYLKNPIRNRCTERRFRRLSNSAIPLTVF